MIIDMLDSYIVKDIEIPIAAFVNNASGKLLLNILSLWLKNIQSTYQRMPPALTKKNIAKGISSGTPKIGLYMDGQ